MAGPGADADDVGLALGAVAGQQQVSHVQQACGPLQAPGREVLQEEGVLHDPVHRDALPRVRLRRG